MQSLQCAACAAPLRADAAGHGHYRMKSARISAAVAACSRPCGAIGLMLAAIGAPPTKRTADDAEMDTNEPKAGRGNAVVVPDAQRQADRRRVERWIRALRAEMAAWYTYPTGLVSSSRLKATALMIGAEIQLTGADAIELLRPLDDRLQQTLAEIDDPTLPPYDMDAVGDVARNIVRRIAQRERVEALAPAAQPESYLSWMPADVRNIVSTFVAGRDDVVSRARIDIQRVKDYKLTKQFVYMQRYSVWTVFQHNGVPIDQFEWTMIRPAGWMFEPSNADPGELIMVYNYRYPAWKHIRHDTVISSGDSDINCSLLVADNSRNVIWARAPDDTHVLQIRVDRDGLHQTPFEASAILQFIRQKWHAMAIEYRPIENGLYIVDERAKEFHFCNAINGRILSMSVDRMCIDRVWYEYGQDGLFYAFTVVDDRVHVKRYDSIPSSHQYKDFRIDDIRDNTRLIRQIIVNGTKFILFVWESLFQTYTVYIVDTKLL